MSDIANAILGAGLEAEPTLPGPANVPWPSDFEIDIRREIADIRAHQSRQDRLLMDVQLEVRRAARSATQLALRVEAKVEELVKLVRSMTENGHGR